MIRRHARGLATAVFLLWVACSAGFAGENTAPATSFNQWLEVDRFIVHGAAEIDRVLINSPPVPPAGSHRPIVESADLDTGRGLVTLDVPRYIWSFGSSTTAAAMIAAWHDRTFFPDLYLGPADGGVMPMDNSVWPIWIDSNGDPQYQCPLSATHKGLDGRANRGHVDDYWRYSNQAGPDPHVGNWIEHIRGDCTGDYMKSNKWYSSQGSNVDGGTIFYFYSNGAMTLAADLEYYNVHGYDGGYGLKLFYESRGYTVSTMYNQYIEGYNGNPLGFTFAQYMAEIDAGQPVMIHIAGHTMVGVGYDDTSGDLIYVNDTWDHSTHTMTWGGSYAGFDHYGATIVQLVVPTLVELTSFTAKGSFGGVFLEWETAAEIDNAGFHLWRSETKEGPFVRITDQLIPPLGGTTWGASYDWWDEGLIAGQTYYYRLEDVDFSGHNTFHGPVQGRVR